MSTKPPIDCSDDALKAELARIPKGMRYIDAPNYLKLKAILHARTPFYHIDSLECPKRNRENLMAFMVGLSRAEMKCKCFAPRLTSQSEIL